MRLIHLPTFWTILIDIIVWFIIHLGVVYFMVRLPAEGFDPQSRLFRIRNWEKKGFFYQKYFRVKKWKTYLPDGAPFLGNRGFPKKELREKNPAYLRSFLLETCRAELTHWITMLFAPFFYLWNPLWVGFFMIFYISIENLPLIMAQRYNRSRLNSILEIGDRES
jgi:glycosyl-4,4'-diaponeurosporenoate acyltransferase